MKPAIYIFFMVTFWLEGSSASKLLKVPRIYNALITSDEELVPSQAYPAVAPVLRPSGPVYLSPAYPEVEPSPAPLPQILEENQWEMLKNNKPSNPDIPDVPPPPLPVTFRLSKSATGPSS